MTVATHPAPDTSREGLRMSASNRLRWWRGKVSNWLHDDSPIPRETPDGATLAEELGAAATEIERLVSRANAEHERAEGLAKEVERLHVAAKEIGNALISFTPGGSEYFVKIGDDYFADAETCKLRIADKFEMLHRVVSEAVRARKAAEAKLAAYEAPVNDETETYYTAGKDAEWFEGLDDPQAADELTKAAQDLNDTGLGNALDKWWLPHNAMLSNAADRIRRLSATIAKRGGDR